jgi:hypothetical protein
MFSFTLTKGDSPLFHSPFFHSPLKRVIHPSFTLFQLRLLGDSPSRVNTFTLFEGQILLFEAFKPKFCFNFFAFKNGFFRKALFNASRPYFDITHFELFVFGRSASLLVVCHFLTNLLTSHLYSEKNEFQV